MAHARYPVLFAMGPGGTTRHFPEHLGTAFLRAVLARAGIDSRQYLPGRNPSLTGFANFLREARPQVVGFTVYESNIIATRAMVRAVREALPDAVVAVGGPNATFSPEETLTLVDADVCQRGAGEGTIASLVHRILGSASPRAELPELLGGVPNLALRSPDGVHFTPAEEVSSFPARYFASLDDIPSPYQGGLVSTTNIGYLTARGCNQNCTYCSLTALSRHRVAFHSVERVLDDLAALEDLDRRAPRRTDDLWIFDDAFTLAPERARQICEGILERGIRLPFSCQTRGDRVTPDLLRLMRRAGFVIVGFGLESAVPRVLRAIGKVCPPDTAGDPQYERERRYLENFRSSIESAKRCGLRVNVSVMAGLPCETADDFRATLAFVESLGVDGYAHNILAVMPGTPLYDRRHAFGLDAFRERETTIWRTVHSYAAGEIRPLRHSNVHRAKWDAAQILADALCGRAEADEAAEDSVRAVVIHDHPPSRRIAEWLRRILAIHGSVITFDASRQAAAEWRGLLTRCRVPVGELYDFVLDDASKGMSFEGIGSSGRHRVGLFAECSADTASAPFEADEDGNCRVAVWTASAPDARVELREGWDCPLVGPGLQVADSCRFGNSPARCRRPRVLHVDSDGAVRACWYGLVIGTVDDEWGGITSRSRATALGDANSTPIEESSRCPLEPLRGIDEPTRSRLWDLDLASQLGWLFYLPDRLAGRGKEMA